MKGDRLIQKRIAVVVADVLALGVCLCVFSYFHHVRVRDTIPTAIPVQQTAAAAAAQATAQPAAASEAAQSGAQVDAAGVDAQSASEPDASGMFGARFADQFASGETKLTPTSYQSKNVSLEITTRQFRTSTYYVADFYVRDITCLRAAVALDYREQNAGSRKNVMQTPELLELAGGVAGVSGDNFFARGASGLAVRNGLEWENKSPYIDDICVLFRDGVMETFSSRSNAAWRTYIENAYARGPWQIWSFGPSLLDETGAAKTSFKSSVAAENPRSAVGYYEPGHYCFVLVDGRQAGYSVGLTLAELSQVFAELGCKVAYNLDGGDTVAMAFSGAFVNKPEGGKPRAVSDILMVAEPLEDGAAAQEAAPMEEAQ